MSNIAKVVSTRLITAITKGGRTLEVHYVDKTDSWTRPYLSSATQTEFVQAAEENFDTVRPDTKILALQEPDHTSPRDQRSHFTAVEINLENEVKSKRHFRVKQKTT